jgi:predicted ATPase
VAYNSLLEQRRQELHRRIGQAIEDLYADQLVEHYEVLAYHFAKGEAWAKALEAADQLDDAVAPQTLMVIHQAKANLYFVLSDFGRSHDEAARLLALARQGKNRVSEAGALRVWGGLRRGFTILIGGSRWPSRRIVLLVR